MADDESSSFVGMKVPELQNFLKTRDIQIALDGKKRRRAELLELCKNAAEMKVPKVDEEIELQDDLIKSKITLPGGKLLPHPLSLKFWTHNFTNIPDFRFPDIYYYLVGKDGYDEACLRSYKSLQGFRLYMDGHVEDLKYHSILDDAGYCYFQFKVKPTERSKTEDGRDHYWGFLVLEISGSIYSAFCACKGGADGACRHVAAALFDLEATIRRNELDTCTSVPCIWIKRKRLQENAVPMERLKIQKSEFGKEHKDYMKPFDFNPCSGSPTQSLTNKFHDALLDTAPSCVALQFIPKPEAQDVSDQQLMEQILSEDIDHEEVVEYVEVYSLKELANIFIAQNNLTSVANPTDEQCGNFVRFLDQHDFAAGVIFQKTLSQNNTSFWFSQRAGRITASNFYKVCHLKETTDPKNTVKLLMNYCPLSNDNTPQQLVWGHEKEITAVKEYVKKYKSKHRGMEVFESGLFIDEQHPYLGATPDRLQVCKCCVKILLEVKGIFSKRNLPPHIAAASYLEKVNGKYYLKKETSWNYQIQGQLAIAQLTHCNLIIYTLKGILVVPVQFDEELWERMAGKLKKFFLEHMVPELLSGKILKEVTHSQ